ncbi:MAG: hypothetical protein BWY57_01284 [Betaproteobacteria bacterium ADurb.Bin341]|nr:MAG: hypothetical protein BWY57_01284 [Betaproteobacteria bacterium ADurb.Bin341]
MDAGRLHGADRADGAGQFALQRALVVDLFGKLGKTEFGVIHQLKTDRTAAWQSLFCQFQADFMNPAGGDQDGAASGRELVGNVLLLERGDDSAAVLVREVGKQHLVVRLGDPEERGHREGDDGGNGNQQR